mgnify:CR=1 FL=1
MVRVDIESVVMTSGPMPMPSVVVLRERKGDGAKDAPARALSIQTGAYEAAAIGHGIDFSRQSDRPLAHDLVLGKARYSMRTWYLTAGVKMRNFESMRVRAMHWPLRFVQMRQFMSRMMS